MSRFLVFSTVFYVLGIILGRYCISLPVSFYLALAALAWVLFNLLSKRDGLQTFFPFFIIFLAAGSMAYNLSLQQVGGNIRNFSGESCTLLGMVEDEPLWQEGEVVFVLRSETIVCRGEEHTVNGKVRVTLRLEETVRGNDEGVSPGGNRRSSSSSKGGDIVGQSRDPDKNEALLNLSYGQQVSLRGLLYEPKERRNPGGFDYRAYLETQGVAATFYGKASELSSLGFSPELSRFRRTALEVKDKMTGVLGAYLPQNEGSLLAGMLFGERRSLDPDMERIFRASGISHLLAVSGLHVGLIAAFIISAAKRVGLKGWQAFLFSVLLLFAYVYICGCKPATLRAFIMILMAMGAVQLGRYNDVPTALAASALVILVFNPLLLFTVGFQLSYLSTLSIILFTPLLTEKISRILSRIASFISPEMIKTISSLAAVTLAAQLGVIPLTAYYFKEISLIALFPNMLILPVMSLLLGLALVAALLGLVFPPVGSILNLAGYPLLVYIQLIAGKAASLPFAYIGVFPPRIGELLLYYLLLLLLAGGWKLMVPLMSRVRQYLRPFHLLILILIPALLLIWLDLPGTAPKKLEIVCLDVGQGDAIFIRTPMGHNILLDGGGNSAFKGEIDEPGRYAVVPFLEYRRIKKLDMVIVSHPHEDHYGGLLAVLDKFPVDMLVTNADLPDLPAYQGFLDLVEKKNITREIVEAGDTFKLGADVYLDVLCPPSQLFSGTSSDGNNNSLVLHLRYRGAGALFTGDIEGKAVEYLLEEELLPECQIIKVPHHGGYFENLTELLNRVSPHTAVISVGSNSFGHPHPAVLGILQDNYVQIYRTDLHGAITIVTDGYAWETSTMLLPLSSACF